MKGFTMRMNMPSNDPTSQGRMMSGKRDSILPARRPRQRRRQRAAGVALGAIALTSGLGAAVNAISPPGGTAAIANGADINVGRLAITLAAHDGFKLNPCANEPAAGGNIDNSTNGTNQGDTTDPNNIGAQGESTGPAGGTNEFTNNNNNDNYNNNDNNYNYDNNNNNNNNNERIEQLEALLHLRQAQLTEALARQQEHDEMLRAGTDPALLHDDEWSQGDSSEGDLSEDDSDG
ncbi:hypothetical protein [Mycobacterium attenuatum]|uniref:hypothetical protein n=1 Tax=Mycobacterium attenuatum TaxID=2341086 RepID=UPI001B7D5E63|nr:hypothetical protein [Mycobacterium attenuatum]